jgi:hypothetical protein
MLGLASSRGSCDLVTDSTDGFADKDSTDGFADKGVGIESKLKRFIPDRCLSPMRFIQTQTILT